MLGQRWPHRATPPLPVSREVGTRTVKAIHAGLINMNDPNNTSEPAGRLQKPVAGFGHTTAINEVTPTQSTGSTLRFRPLLKYKYFNILNNLNNYL